MDTFYRTVERLVDDWQALQRDYQQSDEKWHSSGKLAFDHNRWQPFEKDAEQYITGICNLRTAVQKAEAFLANKS